MCGGACISAEMGRHFGWQGVGVREREWRGSGDGFLNYRVGRPSSTFWALAKRDISV